MKVSNQMIIGMTSRLEHDQLRFIAVSKEGRGLVIYSAIPGGLRLTIHPGDGLDSYYFDLEASDLKNMHDIAGFI